MDDCFNDDLELDTFDMGVEMGLDLGGNDYA